MEEEYGAAIFERDKRSLIPKNKLLRKLDRGFVPSFYIRKAIQETREERRRGIVHSKMSDMANYAISGIQEVPKLCIYGAIVYYIFKQT
jgi:hypothetical protein